MRSGDARVLPERAGCDTTVTGIRAEAPPDAGKWWEGRSWTTPTGASDAPFGAVSEGGSPPPTTKGQG
jgi:hypothetical protein